MADNTEDVVPSSDDTTQDGNANQDIESSTPHLDALLAEFDSGVDDEGDVQAEDSGEEQQAALPDHIAQLAADAGLTPEDIEGLDERAVVRMVRVATRKTSQPEPEPKAPEPEPSEVITEEELSKLDPVVAKAIRLQQQELARIREAARRQEEAERRAGVEAVRQRVEAIFSEPDFADTLSNESAKDKALRIATAMMNGSAAAGLKIELDEALRYAATILTKDKLSAKGAEKVIKMARTQAGGAVHRATPPRGNKKSNLDMVFEKYGIPN